MDSSGDGEEGMPHLNDETEEYQEEGEMEEEYEEGEGGPGEQVEEEEEAHHEDPQFEEMEGQQEAEGEEEEGEYYDEDIPPPSLTNEAEATAEYAEEEDEGHEGQGGPKQEQEEDFEDGENNNNQNAESDTAVKRKRTASHSSADEGPKKKQVRSSSSGSGSGQTHDMYCWVCHKDGVSALCKICPRAYHAKCMHVPEDASKTNQPSETAMKSTICPECNVVMNAENLELRSETMKKLTLDQLITMLKYACQRMKSVSGVEPFLYPVDPEEAVDYFKYIVHPMDLSTLEGNVKKRQYGSTEAFLADAQWLVHNSVVFNSATSPFTVIARKILKICRQEIQDIETCPECYVNAHNMPEFWFMEPCKRPHIIVWAKLKGFPFWPAKAMRIKDDSVDVRFFGAHDRAWVSRKDCFLYSEENPISNPAKRNTALLQAIEELNAHVDKLKEKYGKFVQAPPRTSIGPQLSDEAIRQMLPEFKPEESAATKTTPTGNSNPAAKKSPMTIRISSLKTNPTIVNNSVVEESAKTSTVSKPVNIHKGDEEQEEEKAKLPEKEKGSSSPPKKEATEAGEPLKETEESAANQNTELQKPTGILASALTSNRITRRGSRSETGSGSASPSTSGGVIVRHGKPESAESGEDTGKDREMTPPPPKSFLNSLGLMKTSEVKKKPVGSSQLGKLLHPSEVFVKQEAQDEDEDMHEGQIHRGGLGNQAMRFNLSKDISISPVADDGDEMHVPARARVFVGSGMTGGNTAMRPRQMLHNGGGMQRMGGPRLMMRPQQRPGMQMRPGMRIAGPRQTMPMKVAPPKPKDHVDGAGSFSSNTAVSLNQLSQVQGSIQGSAITLPGGTITVTPLAPVIGVPFTTSDATLNGGQVVVKQSMASTGNNGLPFSVITSQDGGQSILKSNNKPNLQRRNLINQVPATVGHLVGNLQKTLAENVKTTMEQIVLEMLEKTNSGGGAETKALKDENEKLKKQLLEYKHNHETIMREVKESSLADKKRALAEQRKQFEQEKVRVVEETKKKQWCAKCGREAQFYCCWNTSYCGYSCQEEHWPSHMNSCSQGSTSRQ